MLETIVAHGNFLTLDASLPLSRIADFLDKAAPLTQEAGLKPLLIAQPWDADRVAAFTRRMVALLTDFSSSFSAEHGIGRAKVATLAREKQPAQYRLMQTIRHGIDPAGRLSPGLLLEAAE